jgi:hypothetical protein
VLCFVNAFFSTRCAASLGFVVAAHLSHKKLILTYVNGSFFLCVQPQISSLNNLRVWEMTGTNVDGTLPQVLPDNLYYLDLKGAKFSGTVSANRVARA